MSIQLRLHSLFAQFGAVALCAALLPASADAQATLFPGEYSYSSTIGPFGSALADIDGDLKLDLVVANYGGSRISLFSGVGDGSFVFQSYLSMGAAPRSVVVADFNGDSKPDIAVATASADAVAVRLGQGGFAFTAQTSYAVGAFPVWVQAGDVNSDGAVDLVCGSQAGGEISVLIGDGLGGFAAATSFSLGASAEQIRLGDLNGDGALDVVVSSWLNSRLIVMLGDGAGGFTLYSSQYMTAPKGLALHDIDADGNLDAIVTDTVAHKVIVLRGIGNGGFLTPQAYAVGNYPESVDVADFTGDGRPDIITEDAGAMALTVLVNIGQGQFNLAQSSPIHSSSAYMTTGDLNGDGIPDAVVTYYGTGLVRSHLTTTFTGWERYCTAKLNSLGCAPTITASGTPSASNLRPFTVRTYYAIANTAGLFLYRVNGVHTAAPFQGGTLCIGGGALRRSPGLNSSGYPPQTCGGVFELDFNAFAAGLAGGTPDPALRTVGASYLVQTWGRDPGSIPFATSLSDALEVEIGP